MRSVMRSLRSQILTDLVPVAAGPAVVSTCHRQIPANFRARFGEWGANQVIIDHGNGQFFAYLRMLLRARTR
jgi:hypothetical protein